MWIFADEILCGEEFAWHGLANCRGIDSDIFFEEAFKKEAKEICGECQVQDKCLEHAIVNVEAFGTWGGMSERERRKIYR